MSITSKDWWTKCWKPGPSCSSSFSTCCPILGSLQFCPGREWTGSSLSYALNKRHSSGEKGMAEETWPTKSSVGHYVITTTRKCWPRLEAKNTRTSSTFKSLSDSMDIEVYHLSLCINLLETTASGSPLLFLQFNSVPWWGSFHTKYMAGLSNTFLIHTSSRVWMGLIWGLIS